MNTIEGMGSEVPAWARSLWCGWGRRGTSTGLWGTQTRVIPQKETDLECAAHVDLNTYQHRPSAVIAFSTCGFLCPLFTLQGQGSVAIAVCSGLFLVPFWGKETEFP
jgi:hypothetical protein